MNSCSFAWIIRSFAGAVEKYGKLWYFGVEGRWTEWKARKHWSLRPQKKRRRRLFGRMRTELPVWHSISRKHLLIWSVSRTVSNRNMDRGTYYAKVERNTGNRRRWEPSSVAVAITVCLWSGFTEHWEMHNHREYESAWSAVHICPESLDLCTSKWFVLRLPWAISGKGQWMMECPNKLRKKE